MVSGTVEFKKERLTDNAVYWDDRFKRQVVKLLPGEIYVSHGDEMVVTVLGSCVSVCLYETVLGIGGINHFLLPYEETAPHSPRYGNYAMMLLISEIIKRGGLQCNLVAKLFGGGHITQTSLEIGEKNIQFAKDYLKLENIKIESEDSGGDIPRKLYFIPSSNTVFVKRQIQVNTTNW